MPNQKTLDPTLVKPWKYADSIATLINAKEAAESQERRNLEIFFSNRANYLELLQVLGPKKYKKISCRLVDAFLQRPQSKHLLVPNPDTELSVAQSLCMKSAFSLLREVKGKKHFDIYCRNNRELFKSVFPDLPPIITNPCQLNCWKYLIETGILNEAIKQKQLLKEENKKRKSMLKKPLVKEILVSHPLPKNKDIQNVVHTYNVVHVSFSSFVTTDSLNSQYSKSLSKK